MVVVQALGERVIKVPRAIDIMFRQTVGVPVRSGECESVPVVDQ